MYFYTVRLVAFFSVIITDVHFDSKCFVRATTRSRRVGIENNDNQNEEDKVHLSGNKLFKFIIDVSRAWQQQYFVLIYNSHQVKGKPLA